MIKIGEWETFKSGHPVARRRLYVQKDRVAAAVAYPMSTGRYRWEIRFPSGSSLTSGDAGGVGEAEALADKELRLRGLLSPAAASG